MAQVTQLQVEYRTNPLGLDAVAPRFSWKLEGEDAGARQSAYRIFVEDAYGTFVWDSGKVASDRNHLIDYEGMALLPRSRYSFKVWVWNEEAVLFESEKACFETGLMHAGGFLGSWITPPEEGEAESVWRMRRTFTLEAKPERARAYTTAHGIYHLYINGQRVGQDEFTPGWTSYQKRLQYQTYDITPYLQQGTNVVAVELAEGWYKGYLGWSDQRSIYGDKLEFLGRFVMDDVQIHSDDAWVCVKAPYAYAGIYSGLEYDASADDPNWNGLNFDDSGWMKVHSRPQTDTGIVAQENHPPRRREVFKPVECFTTPKGERVIDFGQNLVGWVELSLHGNRGDRAELSHAEVMDAEGNFYTDNYRAAAAKLVYICSGEGEESFRPDLTYYGFRYVRLDAFPDVDPMEALTAVAVYSDMEQTAGFETDNEEVNQLFSNILWGQKGNFLEVPTDCPQRDERLGWTGDAQVFCRTAATLMDSTLFLTKWLRDLAADQRENGGVPHVIPDVLKANNHSSAAWGDAATICPWTLYQLSGDEAILREQYASMKAWVESIRRDGGDGLTWTKGTHFGDWLGLDVPFGTYKGATDEDYIATAFYARSCELLTRTAKILGNKADAKEYAKLHKAILKAFRREYVTKTGRLAVKTQTACVLALEFNLVKTEHRGRVLDLLVELIEKAGCALTTGFVGTPYLCRVLSVNGRHDLAAKLFLRRDYPSWLYPISKGATTMWEHWDGIRPDGSFWSRDMNSYNHYAYGSIAEFMIRDLAGLDNDEAYPGYTRLVIHPTPCEGLDRVKAWITTPKGRAACAWEKTGNTVAVDVTIPWNTKATVILPVEPSCVEETEDGLCIACAQGTKISLSAGTYRFAYTVKE